MWLCSPQVPKEDKDLMWYLQKHGENLETDPPSYGCLHPKWQKQHKDKSLSVEEWSLLWQAEMCAMKPVKAKTSHHMTSLDKWTVSAQYMCCLLCRLAAEHVLLATQDWCQGDLTCTPAKHAEFLTHIFEEALASTLADPWRYYQTTASSVTSKLLDRHGYGDDDDDYKPMKSERHRTRGKQLLLLQKERLGW